MADDITVTPGTGATIAADDIGGALHQRVKIVWGVDGAGVDASATNPLPVTVSNASVAVTGTFWQATQPVSGTFWQATQPVSLAAVPSHAVTNAGTFAVQVDGSALTSLQLIDDVVKLEDAAHASGDAGVMALAVRTDTAAAVAGTTGDYIPLITDALGKLWVTGAYAEDVASADGDRGLGMLAVRKATPANTSGTDGDYEFLQISAGRLWVSSVTTQMTPGVGATDLGKAEDAAHASGDTGVYALAVIQAAPASSAADGDYGSFKTDSIGALWTRDTGPATGTQSIVADTASATTILASNTARRGASVFNDSSAILYLLVGTGTASSTVYTCRVASGGYYEVPAGYTGVISGIWATDPNDGAARVTEWT